MVDTAVCECVCVWGGGGGGGGGMCTWGKSVHVHT